MGRWSLYGFVLGSSHTAGSMEEKAMRVLVMIAVMLMVGCASTSTQKSLAPSYKDVCKMQGGVLYKGPLDRDYRCVSRESMQGLLNQAMRGARR